MRGAPGRGPLAPGELRVAREGVDVGTGAYPVRLGDVRPQGKRDDAGGRLGPRRAGGAGRTAVTVTPPPGPRTEPPDSPRLAAYDCVLGVARDDAYANLALPALLREAAHHRP